MLCLACIPSLLVGQGYERFIAFKTVKFFKEARQKAEKGDFAGAIADYNLVVDLNPNHTEVFQARAEAYFQSGQYQEAKNDFSKAIRLNPGVAELYHRRGQAYMEMGYYSSAMRDFERALRLKPGMEAALQSKQAAERKIYQANKRPYANKPNQDAGSQSRDWEGEGWGETRWDQPVAPQGTATTASGLFSRTSTHHYPKVTGKPNDYLSIERIQLTPHATEVSFKIRSPQNKVVAFSLQKPGNPGAFYLSDRSFRNRYRLIGQKGLPGWEKEVKVFGGRSRTFVLTFEKIPDTYRFIHLIEGNAQGGDAWNFYDIDLKK